MVVTPGGVADYGSQSYHLVSGTFDRDETGCPFSARLLGRGDHVGFDATGEHRAAAAARVARTARERKPVVRILSSLERLLQRASL